MHAGVMAHIHSVSNDESHYTVSISVGIGVRVDCIVQNLAPPGTPLGICAPSHMQEVHTTASHLS